MSSSMEYGASPADLEGYIAVSGSMGLLFDSELSAESVKPLSKLRSSPVSNPFDSRRSTEMVKSAGRVLKMAEMVSAADSIELEFVDSLLESASRLSTLEFIDAAC